MHIALLLSDMRGGGAQKMVINLGNWLSRNGHQVDLISICPNNDYSNYLYEGVNLIQLNKSRAIKSIWALSRYIKNNNPQILFTALFHVNLIAIISKIISGNQNPKLFISERNNISSRLKHLPAIKHFFWHRLISLLYPLSDKIICISNGVKDDLAKFTGITKADKMKVIYNPVVTDEFEDNLNSNVPNIFPINCKVKLITSGRLVPQKDYPTLFRSLSSFLKIEPSTHLVILGSGSLETELKAMTKDLKIDNHVTFAGFVSNPLAYMKQAEIFIITSAWEGFCNVIVEALYCGLKVVSTNCPSGPSEILKDGTYGKLVKVGDNTDIKNAITEIIKSPHDKYKQKDRALDFHIDVIGKQFIESFENTLHE